ncbi:MAG: hypothetical protein ACM3H7_01620 [Acidobacteriaceae bacterium]
MNIHYPIQERANLSILLLLAVAVLLASLVLAYQAAYQPVVVNFVNPSNLSGSQELPHPISIPEPPHSSPAFQSRVSSTPIPQGILQNPAPQPIPTHLQGQ